MTRGTALLVPLSCLIAGVAAAQGPTAAPVSPPVPATGVPTEPAATAPPGAPPARPLFTGTHLGAYVSFAEIPGLLLGLNHERLVLAAGFTFKYDGNAKGAGGAGAPAASRFSSGTLLSVAYIVHDRYPVAFGPALAYSTTFVPGAVFDQQFVSGSMAFYFAPFPAPLVLVTVLSSRLILAKGREPVFELITPSLLVGYLIR
jgi:hypothetical protein